MSELELFTAELRDLGVAAVVNGGFVFFEYDVEVGPLAGERVRVALNASAHPHSPPTGPFVSPRLLPIQPDGSPAPFGGVHEAAGRDGFEDPRGEWQYWSRPFNEWLVHGRTAKAYVSFHLRRLFAGLPQDLEVECAA